MCIVKALNIAFKNVKTVLAGDLLCSSLQIFRFTPIHQEAAKQDKNVTCFKECFDVETSAVSL